MNFRDIQPVESVSDLLSQGWIILEKDGIIDLFGNSKVGILKLWKQHTKKP